MWSKVKLYADKHRLIDTARLYVVALSGGADSVALLLLLHEHGCNIHAAHCNFHLRGAESDRDELFCEDLCRRLGVPLHRAHFDTQTYAELHKVSIEMAARKLRYRWFEQLRSDLGADGICVAHHRDDSVETVLLNLVRGTGLRGLTGIRPRNGYILRPLLCVSREDIEQYLSEKKQAYVTDSTNLEVDVQRNKVRLQLLPLLRTLNPAVDDNIQRTAEYLTEAQAVLDTMTESIRDRDALELRELESSGSAEYMAYEWLKGYGFNGAQVRQALAAETGRVFSSATGFDLLRDRDRLLVKPALKPLKPLVIPEEGVYVMGDEVRFTVRREAVWVSKTPDCATVDARKVRFPLTVRRVAEGDTMHPYGMKGRKLLSDLMTDRKMTAFEKRRQLVVVDATGTIVWLVGLRTDERCKVDENTTEALSLLCAKEKTKKEVHVL